MTDRQRDAQTIKPRQFMLNLSDNDIRQLYRLANGNGITPAEILQGFICDLIDGTQTRGSDERDLAQRYFDRCCYSLGMPQTFLSWLLQEWRIDEIADLYKEYAEAQERQREPAQEMQEGIEAVKAYLLELETITAGK